MKHIMMAVAASFVSYCAIAANATAMTPEERAAKHKAGLERRIAQSGGWIEKRAEGKTVRIVDSQKIADRASVDAVVASVKQALQLSIEVVEGVPGKRYRPDEEAAVIVSIVADDDDATLVTAPEQAWAVVNTSALSKDSPSSDVLAARVQKEVWRGLAILLGASNSMTQPCVMRQINSLSDLDATKTLTPCPEPFNAMLSTASKLGLGRTYRTTYRKACKEGWAPQPTNDAQRVIWEEFHSKPSEPIKIKFDPEKGL